MALVVGLGNPGTRYARTRHNVGWRVVEILAKRWKARPEHLPGTYRGWSAELGSRTVHLLQPLTFMNLSGHAIGDLLRFYKIDLPDLFVVVDDANLELGRLRARPSGSAGGHNGLKSIIEALGTEEFARLRVGVGRGAARQDLADHVLAKFDPDERIDVAEAVGRAADAAELFVTDGIVAVMNRFNRKEDGE